MLRQRSFSDLGTTPDSLQDYLELGKPLPSEYGTYKTVKARFWHLR